MQAALGTDGAPDLRQLDSQPVALDCGGRLQSPASLLFNDAPTLAARLGDRLGDRLIARQEDVWRALAEAGVENLSDAVDVEILGPSELLDPGELRDRIQERAGLLARVVDAFVAGEGAAARGRAHSLQVDASTQLLVRYHVDSDDREDVYRVRALYERDAHTLHVAVEDGSVAWTECAKEMARALAPSLLPHTVAPCLRAAMEPATFAEAEAELNDLDVPRLQDEQQVDWAQASDDWSSAEDEAETDSDDFGPESEATEPVSDAEHESGPEERRRTPCWRTSAAAGASRCARSTTSPATTSSHIWATISCGSSRSNPSTVPGTQLGHDSQSVNSERPTIEAPSTGSTSLRTRGPIQRSGGFRTRVAVSTGLPTSRSGSA